MPGARRPKTARAFIRLLEHAAEQGTLRGDPERGRGDLHRRRGQRSAVGAHQVGARVAIGADVRDRPHGSPELVVEQRAILLIEDLQVEVLDLHDAIAVRQRQLAVHQHAEHLEGDGPEPDAERHRQTADDGQAWVFREHPEAQLQVEREAVEHEWEWEWGVGRGSGAWEWECRVDLVLVARQ
jgi:hypothetical protein